MNKYAFGITSVCEDGNHIFMADIDENIPFSNIIDLVIEIIKKYHLYFINIVKSSNGWNLFSYDKMSLKMIYEINKNFPSIDQKYNDLQFFGRNFYTLRVGSDKKFIQDFKVGIDKPIYVQSNAHRIFFNALFNRHLPKNLYYDDYEFFRIIRFLNNKHGVLMDDKKRL